MLRAFYRDMSLTRAFDIEATNLQRQGEMALWVPSHGQEAAQVGSARAARPQDHLFPSYREHAAAMVRGVDPVDIIRMLRGLTHGGWNPAAHGNFHIYTLVIGSHALHATGYAMGILFDNELRATPARKSTGTKSSTKAVNASDDNEAVIAYFGDGATSQGDVAEAFVFAASYRTPQVFFVQNNHWAISVPVSVQSRTPLYLRGTGYGIPSVQIDGNDVLVSYAVSTKALTAARSGEGPQLIEALTYRMGAHTTSDDPTKYRSHEEHESWAKRDPITRYEKWLRSRGADDAFFAEIAAEAGDLAADIRRRTLALQDPVSDTIFDHVYSEPHPVMSEQKQWLTEYSESFGDAS
ncbi:MAG: thiamine pyrophosphate-dependent dehydrogenase E1 component subunit alpha [Cryobacterium sp.]|nr:thiamine pyrophosphate-dependent dehydrogenase E1 component subunit alpha [Cryobacterium sp.]